MTREQLVARAIEEDAQALAGAILRDADADKLKNMVWNMHDPHDSHQPDPCFIAAVVAQVVMVLGPNHSMKVQAFQIVLFDALVNNPGFEV
jgi:hypothetical protein